MLLPSSTTKPRIVIADDDPAFLRAMVRTLAPLDAEVIGVGNGDEAKRLLQEDSIDILLSDVDMPGIKGDALLEEAANVSPATVVILMTGAASVQSAVAALRQGAFDYLEKPFPSEDMIRRVLRRALDYAVLKRRNVELEHVLDKHVSFEGMVGQAAVMRDVFSLIESVAYSDATVLVQGESGTGKELAARALHERSPRRQKPFIAVNCAALTETLLESELFGYVKGAFTGADTPRRGLFEAADHGTIFLDEIGHVSPAVQVRLLRVLQENEVRRVGATESTKIDVRVVAATNIDLLEAVKKGQFRQDLFYRLAVIEVKLPALRERGDDLQLVAQHLLVKHATKVRKNLTGFTPEAMAAINSYAWPGNVRELENAVQRAVVIAKEAQVQRADLPTHVSRMLQMVAPVVRINEPEALPDLPFMELKRQTVESFERRYLTQLMSECEGNVSMAARKAGLDRSNFRRLLKEYGLARSETGLTA